MRAVTVTEDGDPEHMTIGEVPTPEPGSEEVLVKVHATALNRADTFQRRGHYPPPEGASEILGLEMAGTVAEAGDRVVDWNENDRVFALLDGGGYAEYAVVHKDRLMAVPPGLSMQEATAIPEVFLTAYQALHWLGGVQSDHDVLIHAGASGVGTAAIQLARLAEAHPYVTASAPKHEVCRDLGAEVAIDYESEDFAERIDEITEDGADIILDFIGAPYFHQNVSSLALDGRIIQLATLGGSTVEQVNLRALMAKRAQLFATTLRSRSLAYKVQLTQEFASDVLPHFIDGDLQPVIDSVYDWTEVADAHRRMENNENAGKIVMTVVS
ncbi:NADPH:quinone oxidoreductase [Salinibacter sp. 10B]|uniref:NAD(P)H-quinone oxidoreductase n=1 Tax=Salinibacter sp. 10B TaxID=1923971 RepID=UPI000CF4D8D0|nr:NAD(P)H-quinone oxidoreductase [Salinibacter sp. 10B]PQJ34170.1 NADPH:quinone oxidoreductase [Salinibacter sp. 10B]